MKKLWYKIKKNKALCIIVLYSLAITSIIIFKYIKNNTKNEEPVVQENIAVDTITNKEDCTPLEINDTTILELELEDIHNIIRESLELNTKNILSKQGISSESLKIEETDTIIYEDIEVVSEDLTTFRKIKTYSKEWSIAKYLFNSEITLNQDGKVANIKLIPYDSNSKKVVMDTYNSIKLNMLGKYLRFDDLDKSDLVIMNKESVTANETIIVCSTANFEISIGKIYDSEVILDNEVVTINDIVKQYKIDNRVTELIKSILKISNNLDLKEFRTNDDIDLHDDIVYNNIKLEQLGFKLRDSHTNSNNIENTWTFCNEGGNMSIELHTDNSIKIEFKSVEEVNLLDVITEASRIYAKTDAIDISMVKNVADASIEYGKYKYVFKGTYVGKEDTVNKYVLEVERRGR